MWDGCIVSITGLYSTPYYDGRCTVTIIAVRERRRRISNVMSSSLDSFPLYQVLCACARVRCTLVGDGDGTFYSLCQQDVSAFNHRSPTLQIIRLDSHDKIFLTDFPTFTIPHPVDCWRGADAHLCYVGRVR